MPLSAILKKKFERFQKSYYFSRILLRQVSCKFVLETFQSHEVSDKRQKTDIIN